MMFERSVAPAQLHPGHTFAARATTLRSPASNTSTSYDALKHEGAQQLFPELVPHSDVRTR